MKPHASAALLCAAFIVISGFCLISADTAKKPVELVFWSASETTIAPDSGMKFSEAVRVFEKNNPDIIIDYQEKGDYMDYKMKLQNALNADAVPDVFTSYLGGYLKPHIEQGRILALETLLTPKTKSALLEGALFNTGEDGHIYALPFRGTVAFILCNTEIFEQNHLSYPQTFAELVSLCKKLKDLRITPFAQNTDDNTKWANLFLYETLVLRHGGFKTAVENGVRKADFGSPAFLAAAKDIKALVDAGAFPEENSIGYSESVDMFFSGKAAMYYGGTWALGMGAANNRLIVENKLKAIRFPAVNGGKGDIRETWGGAFMALAVNGKCAHKKEAVRFIEFLSEYIAEHASKCAVDIEADISLWKAYAADKAKYDINSQVNAMAVDSNVLVMGWDMFIPESDTNAYWDSLYALIKGSMTPEEFYSSLPGNAGK
jgi:raffinose/stachyose/melibiose transport system substrate-binding protein